MMQNRNTFPLTILLTELNIFNIITDDANKMKVKLKDIAQIKAGYPFRGKIPEVESGGVRVIQMRDISNSGGLNWNSIISTEVTTPHANYCLAEGDVVFIARGSKNIAAYVGKVNPEVICSPHFYLIRQSNTERLLPEFLAWQLNQQPAQKYLKQSAEGTAQASIRRGVLEDLLISIPGIKTQQTIIALAEKARQEKQRLLDLIANREQQLNGIATQVLSQNVTK